MSSFNPGLDLKALELLKEQAKLHPQLQDLVNTWEKHKEKEPARDFITVDSDMIELKKQVGKLCVPNDPVLIVGETGTGKEIIARALHGERKGAFVALNCAGLPETLIESELFGHVKGAFTGADRPKSGLMEAANGGTIFLDEIAEMDICVQPKLLRALQEKIVRRVGGTEDIKINCRVVCATNKNIEQMAFEHKTFRDDLYWRISTFILKTKPLCDRLCDVIPILTHLDSGENKGLLLDIMDEFVAPILQSPHVYLRGNVRQLQQFVRRYYVLGEMPGERLL
jgi:two-component system, NtrC family, response regulator